MMFGINQDEINGIKSEIKSEIKDYFKEQVEEICLKAIIEMFGDERDEIYESFGLGCHGFMVKTIGGELKGRMLTAIDEDYAKKADEAVAKNVEGEEFIDRIIERIKKKQLG